MYWHAYRESYGTYMTMVEKIVGSTFSFSNVHGFIYVNSYCYRSIIIDAIKMHQCDTSKCLITNKEPNESITIFFLSFERL